MVACIRYEDWLDNISNYLQWIVKMSTNLMENKRWSFVNTIVVVPTVNIMVAAGGIYLYM